MGPPYWRSRKARCGHRACRLSHQATSGIHCSHIKHLWWKKWVSSIKIDLLQKWNYPLISGRLRMCHVIEPVTHILDDSIYMWYTVVWQMWNIMGHCMANLSIRKMTKSTWKMELSNPSRAQRRSMAKARPPGGWSSLRAEGMARQVQWFAMKWRRKNHRKTIGKWWFNGI